MIDRCECCDGRKKLLQLGGIYGDCKHCKGVGYVTVDEKLTVDNFTKNELAVADILTDDFLTAEKLPDGDIIVTKKRATLKRASKAKVK